MAQRLTAHELRYNATSIVDALTNGEAFVLVDNGRLIGRLIPVSPPDAGAAEPPSDMVEIIEQCVQLLGEEMVSRIIGLTWLTFATQRKAGQLTDHVRERLLALAGSLHEQSAWLPAANLQAWWSRPQRELAGRSPASHLALPWKTGDAHSSRVFALIHRQRLLHEVASQEDSPRARRNVR